MPNFIKFSFFSLCLSILIMLTSCTSPISEVQRVVENAGYTDVVSTGFKPLSCSEDDTYQTGFTALNVKGKRISGVVCKSFFKSYTVRLD